MPSVSGTLLSNYTSSDPTQIHIKYSGISPHEVHKCRHCTESIHDLYYLDIASTFQWHLTCLKCSICKCVLRTKCFIKNGKFYCKHDYERLIEQHNSMMPQKNTVHNELTCRTCYKTIQPNEYVIRLDENFIYHYTCFFCYLCLKHIKPGEKYGIINCTLFCGNHYAEQTGNYDPIEMSNEMRLSSPLLYAQSSVHSTDPSSSSPFADDFFVDAQPNGNSLQTQIHEHSIQTTTTGFHEGDDDHDSQYAPLACTHDWTHSDDLACKFESHGIRKRKDSNEIIPLTSYDSTHLDVILDNSVDVDLNPDDHKDKQKPNGKQLIMRETKKRSRTSFKHQQLRIMKAYFHVNQNPDSKKLKDLSDRTGLTKRTLQVWFQNSRAKERKIISQLCPKQQQTTDATVLTDHCDYNEDGLVDNHNHSVDNINAQSDDNNDSNSFFDVQYLSDKYFDS